jgi:hypothetical protein
MIIAGRDADEVQARARNQNLMQSPIDEALRWFAN